MSFTAVPSSNTLIKLLSVALLTIALTGCISTEKPDPDDLPPHIEFREGVVDYQGHFIVPPVYDGITRNLNPNGHFTADKKAPIAKDTGNNGYDFELDQAGRVLSQEYIPSGKDWKLTYEYENEDFRTGNYRISYTNPNLKAQLSKSNNKYGFINKDGKWMIPPQWDFVHGFKGNPPTTFVWIYGHPFSRWGIIDQKGHYLLKPTCVGIHSFENATRPMKICRIPFTFEGKQL
jgi:hypothetical protein